MFFDICNVQKQKHCNSYDSNIWQFDILWVLSRVYSGNNDAADM